MICMLVSSPISMMHSVKDYSPLKEILMQGLLSVLTPYAQYELKLCPHISQNRVRLQNTPFKECSTISVYKVGHMASLNFLAVSDGDV